MTRDSLHLTVDDLDALLDGHLDLIKLRHIEMCDDCREFARAEQQLAARLAALPLFSPAPGFTERVMVAFKPAEAPVPIWTRTRRTVFASRRSLAIAASLTVAVLGSMGASVAWSLTHQETMTAAGQWLTTQGGQALWVGLPRPARQCHRAAVVRFPQIHGGIHRTTGGRYGFPHSRVSYWRADLAAVTHRSHDRSGTRQCLNRIILSGARCAPRPLLWGCY